MSDFTDYTPEQSFSITAATLLLQQSVRACATAQSVLEFSNAWRRLGTTARAAAAAIIHCSSVDELICLSHHTPDAMKALAAVYRHRLVSLRILAWLMIHLTISEDDVRLILAERLVRTDRFIDLGLLERRRRGLRLTPAGRAVRSLLENAKLPLGVK